MVKFLIILNIIFIPAFIVLLTGYLILAKKDPNKRKNDRDLLIGFLSAIICGSLIGIAMFGYERNEQYEKEYEIVVRRIYTLYFQNKENFTIGLTDNGTNYEFTIYIEKWESKIWGQGEEKVKVETTVIYPLEYSIYSVPTWTKKKEKGELHEYDILYLPDNHVILPF